MSAHREKNRETWFTSRARRAAAYFAVFCGGATLGNGWRYIVRHEIAHAICGQVAGNGGPRQIKLVPKAKVLAAKSIARVPRAVR